MTKLTATQREAAKAAGIDRHPADDTPSPPAAALAEHADEATNSRLRHIGGSKRHDFNVCLAETVLSAAWTPDAGDKDCMLKIVGFALAGIGPRDELEGMLAGQMVAAHQAAMECFRRAMLPTQSVEGRAMNLNQGNKASRTYAMLLDGLNRHRSQGQQRVVVEHVHRHVHVHEGGSQIGPAQPPGEGAVIENESQPHAQKAVSYALQPSLRSEDPEREAVPRTGDVEREVPNARRR